MHICICVGIPGEKEEDAHVTLCILGRLNVLYVSRNMHETKVISLPIIGKTWWKGGLCVTTMGTGVLTYIAKLH